MLLLTLILADAVLVAGAIGVSRQYERGRGRDWKLRVFALVLWTALVLALTLTYLIVVFASMKPAAD